MIKKAVNFFEKISLMFCTRSINNKISPIKTTFFQNVSHGVNFIASPKHPQSVTLL